MDTGIRQLLINFYKEEMIAFMAVHSECFDEAVALAIADEPRLSWRAAWLLWSCMKDNDRRIRPYIKKIITSFNNKGDGHKRELIKILMMMNLDDKSEGMLYDICTSLWKQTDKTPSVRITAFKFMVEAAKKYPELSIEIELLTQEEYLSTLSPGVRRSVMKMIKQLFPKTSAIMI